MQITKARLSILLLLLFGSVLSMSAWAVDTDGDGYDDGVDAFPNDPAAAVDTDGDGMPDEFLVTVIDDFETGDFNANPWVSGNGWNVAIDDGNAYEGSYMALGGGGNLELSMTISSESALSFFYRRSILTNCSLGCAVEQPSSLGVFLGGELQQVLELERPPNCGVPAYPSCWGEFSLNLQPGDYTFYWVAGFGYLQGGLGPGANIVNDIDYLTLTVVTALLEDADDDNDGLPDDYENAYAGLNPLVDDANSDIDGDGLTNLREYELGTNPEVADVRATNDTNADFDSDIIWRRAADGSLVVWNMQNNTKTGESELGTLGTDYDLKDTFDIDSDGDSDLILFNESLGQAIAWSMENNAKVSGALLAGFPGYTVRGLGDVDADGDGDIVWQEVATGRVIVWIMEGGAKQSGNFLGGLGAGSVVEAIGDFDNDGDDDLLWSLPAATALVRWDMENGIKQTGASIGGFVGYSIAATGDINGDSTDDILWKDDSSGYVIAWQMQNGTKSTGTALGAFTGFGLRTVGDYDGDGDADLLWSGSANYDAWIWTMENGSKQSTISIGSGPDNSHVRPQ